MKKYDRINTGAESKRGLDAQDQTLKQALSDFKANVCAWSTAEFNRPRTVSVTVVRRTWRMAAGWALASVLLAGALSGGVFEQRYRREQERIAAARTAEHQREVAAAQARAKAEADLFAQVDTDVSQEVPDALEPLAELSAQSQSR